MTTILEAAHDLHGGDETPRPLDCPVCEADVEYFLRWGEGRPEPEPDGDNREGQPAFNGAFDRW